MMTSQRIRIVVALTDRGRDVLGTVLDACSPVIVKLTPKQAEWVDWAIGGMLDHVLSDDDDVGYTEDALPVLTGRTLDLSAVTANSVTDLFYRLEQQAPDMDDDMNPRSTCVAATNAANLIRQHCTREGIIE